MPAKVLIEGRLYGCKGQLFITCRELMYCPNMYSIGFRAPQNMQDSSNKPVHILTAYLVALA